MATYERNRCKNCGAPLDLTRAKGNVVKCEYCGECFILPKDGAGEKVCSFLAIGEHCLDTADFTGAYTAYEKAAQLHHEEPEAYFGMALATAKVQYLQDVVNNRLQPICHEIAKKKVMEDKNYQKAIALATAEQKAEYEKRAREIDEIREKFYEFRHAGLDYDCFLCVKVTGEDGKHTEDSFIASKIYKELKKEGYAPFYSEEEIGERTGSDYEALILYALYTAECMLAVCSDEEYLLTPWVKNEYTRFLRLLSDEEKERDSFAFVFDGTPVERIPGRHGKVQGINFKDGTAMKKIEKFVAVHTPEAKKRREEEAKRKAEEEERKNRIWEEMAQRLRKYEEAEEAAKRADEERRVAEQHKAEEIAAAEAQKRTEEEKRIAEEFEIEDGVLVDYKGTGGEVIIPEGVMEIGDSAFENYESVTSVTIPDGVTRIGECAFDGCSSLVSVEIPDSVTRIGECAFENTAYYNDENNWENNALYIGNCLIAVQSEISGDYRIKTGTRIIADYTFAGCSSLTAVTIPDCVKSIGEGTFCDCNLLANITVEEGNPSYCSVNNCLLTKDGKTLVAGCKSSIIPDGVTNIGGAAFSGCSSLTTVTIPDGVTEIGACAFRDCSSLTRIAISDSVTSIGDWAFLNCKSLVSVAIPDGVTSIGYATFCDCSLLTSVTIPNSVMSIGEAAFSWCSSLISLTIPNSVTSIGRGAFHCCDSLMSVTIPNTVMEIGWRAFGYCRSLTSVIVSDSVTSIGEDAFFGCKELTVYCNEAQAELVEQTGGKWEKEWDSTKKCYKLRYIK